MNNNQPVELGISWEVIEGVLKGTSAIDMPQLSISTAEEAEQFIRGYGFDYHHERDRQELETIQEHAISFIERRLLDPRIHWEALEEVTVTNTLPATHRSCDTRQLLLYASKGTGISQYWACAILKVMHILCHIENTLLYYYFEEAKTQILSRYYQVLSHSAQGAILLNSPDGSQLAISGFEIKDEKTRDSMIIKLLCKKEAVAEEIFDMIGVRLITKTPGDAIVALEILRRNKIVMATNIIPSRSRNALIDISDFQNQYSDILEDLAQGVITLKQARKLFQSLQLSPPGAVFNPENQATHQAYHAIHLTERQLIRFKVPGRREEVRFFFPYEIQIVDEHHYIENHTGSSAHTHYKQKQLIQARRRVLAPLIKAHLQQSAPEALSQAAF